jgi:hypothetical protein
VRRFPRSTHRGMLALNILDTKESGRIGGYKRAAKLTPEQRRQSASNAARARWAKLSAEQRSEASRKMLMVRWSRVADEVSESLPISSQLNHRDEFLGAGRTTRDLVARLGAVTKAATSLSLQSLELPIQESIRRRLLLDEFRSAVSEFLEIRRQLQRSYQPL